MNEYRFTMWDDTPLVITVDDEDPGDKGEPRTLVDYDNGPTTYVSVQRAVPEAGTPDLAHKVRDAIPAEPRCDFDCDACRDGGEEEGCACEYVKGENPLCPLHGDKVVFRPVRPGVPWLRDRHEPVCVIESNPWPCPDAILPGEPEGEPNRCTCEADGHSDCAGWVAIGEPCGCVLHMSEGMA